MKIDPRSDRVALYYTGNEAGEPAVAGVPARDLTENDLARLIYVEQMAKARAEHDDKVKEGDDIAQPVEPPELSDEDLATINADFVERLLEGPYQKTKPSGSKGKDTTDKPGAPADNANGEPA